MTDQTERIGIFGAGTMGTGIAINAVVNGIQVSLYDTSPASIDIARARADRVLARWVEKGRITKAEHGAALLRLNAATLKEAAGTDLIIEAVFEDLEVKKALLRQIEPHLNECAVVASNTSALKVGDIAGALGDPGRVIGLHYFSPAEVNPLCELINTTDSSSESIALARGFLAQTGRVVLECGDTPGFIVNRFFIPLYDEAARIHEEGLASAAVIDAVSRDLFQAGAGLITVINVIGTRTAYHAAANLAELGPDYVPCALLKRLSAENAPIAIDGDAKGSADRKIIEDRLLGALLMPVSELLETGAATIEQIDTGAKHALKYACTPGMILADLGPDRAAELVAAHRARRQQDSGKAA